MLRTHPLHTSGKVLALKLPLTYSIAVYLFFWCSNTRLCVPRVPMCCHLAEACRRRSNNRIIHDAQPSIARTTMKVFSVSYIRNDRRLSSHRSEACFTGKSLRHGGLLPRHTGSVFPVHSPVWYDASDSCDCIVAFQVLDTENNSGAMHCNVAASWCTVWRISSDKTADELNLTWLTENKYPWSGLFFILTTCHYNLLVMVLYRIHPVVIFSEYPNREGFVYHDGIVFVIWRMFRRTIPFELGLPSLLYENTVYYDQFPMLIGLHFIISCSRSAISLCIF